MKKLLCFLVVLSMLLSVFSITSFATQVETTVWTQDFENTTGFKDEKKGSYESGARYYTGGAAWTRGTGILEGEDNNVFCLSHTTGKYGARFKICLDQSFFKKGEKYKLVADMTYKIGDELTGDINLTEQEYNTYAQSYPTLNTTVGVAESASTITYDGEITTSTKKDYVLNLNSKQTVETLPFEYGKTDYADNELSLFVTFSSKTGVVGIQVIKIDNVKIVKISDEKIFNTSADAGYYEEGDGVIAFNAETLYGKDDATAYGMYIYRNDLGESEKVELKSSDISVFEENDGKFFATVTNIPAEYFGEKVACKPYIVVDGKVIFGDVLTYSVNDSNKYLGAKGE